MLYDCEIEYFGGPKDGVIEVVQLEGDGSNKLYHGVVPPQTQKAAYVLCGCFAPYDRPRFRYRQVGVKFDPDGFGDVPRKAED